MADPSQPSDLQSMLARLRGLSSQAQPSQADNQTKTEAAPATPVATAAVAPPAAAPAPPAAAAPPPVAAPAPPAPAAAAPAAPAAVPSLCSNCKAARQGNEEFCFSCGFVFTAAGGGAGAAAATIIKDRYQLGELVWEREGVARYKGFDNKNGRKSVVVLRGKSVPAGAEPVPVAQPAAGADGDAPMASSGPPWPSVAWERTLLEKATHPALPKIIESFTEDGIDYLVEEVPVGNSLWDSWDDFSTTYEDRFGWLKSIAEGLHQIHQAGAILEALRPDLVTITTDGQARLNDLTDLLPLPLPSNPPVRGTYYTAPELALAREGTDARAALYSFGGMLYALTLGVELTDKDFDPKSGIPKNFIARFPDVHPLMGRIVSKTFCRDPMIRFPTDEPAKKDPTGFTELIDNLETGRKSFDTGRLEISSWTTTGIVRTGNEDAFALLHATESCLEDISEFALLLLADGMGGYEAGEIAAALCIQTLRRLVIDQPMFAALKGLNHPPLSQFNAEEMKKLFYEALKETNRIIFEAPMQKPPIGRRGMGCTAEIVYIDGRNIVVGHVGDSRTYLLHDGKFNMITRDQTLVNRLVELGQITEEEAESHPRKNELQQAVGGRRDVEPAVYSAKMKAGDWVLVTSDGLIGHIKNDEIQEMFQSEAVSAEMAARRLVNFANLRGATDNSTVITVRVS